jgi:hypothetical protein
MLLRILKRPLPFILIAILAATLFAISPQAGEIEASPPPVEFHIAHVYYGGWHPWHLTLGDFNGDQKHDIAIANWYGYAVSVFLGTGTGAFSSRVSYDGGGNPWSIATADLNGDGKLDLATSNPDNSSVNVFLGTGTGTFQAPQAYYAGYNPENLAIGDLNNDGVLDVAVASYFGNNAGRLLGTGTGALQAPTFFPSGSGSGHIVLKDLNSDGALDIVTPNYFGNNVSVLLGNGNGTFASAVIYPVGANPRFVAAGDLNNDGKLDLAVTNLSGNSVSLLIGNGDGTFGASVQIPVGSGPNAVALGDLNGDTNIDLAVANKNSNNIGVLLGNGDGTFQSQITFSIGAGPIDIAVADLNEDSKLDLAVLDFDGHSLSILLNGPAPAPTPTATAIVTATPLPTATPTATPTAAVPPEAHSLTINGGALATTSANVELAVSAANSDGSQAGLSMSFSNDGIGWSDWQPYASFAQRQLAGGDGVKTVYGRFKSSAGLLSAVVSDTITLDTSVQQEYGLTINDGALYTRKVLVNLTISAKPGTAEMQVSNDGGFGGISWEPYTSHTTWEITRYRHQEITRLVYIRFRDAHGNVSAISLDDIILDMNPPGGHVDVISTSQGNTLILSAIDDVSGVDGMRLSTQADFAGANWEPFASSRAWEFEDHSTVYVQFRDNAGNESQIYTASVIGSKLVFVPLVLR